MNIFAETQREKILVVKKTLKQHKIEKPEHDRKVVNDTTATAEIGITSRQSSVVLIASTRMIMRFLTSWRRKLATTQTTDRTFEKIIHYHNPKIEFQVNLADHRFYGRENILDFVENSTHFLLLW